MPAIHTESERLAALAEQHLPGGVNSPVRAFRAVGGQPLLFQSASGCRMTDVDGNQYIDFVGSWGPMLLGHAHPKVVAAVQAAAGRGLSFGATNPAEIELAQTIRRLVPSIEMVRLVSSGTEAVMSAIRVARGFTGRAGIIKLEGCYHGHSDCLLAKAGSGTMTFGLPDSAGIPAEVTHHTLTLPFNDLEAAQAIFREKGSEIAAFVIEPVAGNMGVVPPAAGYLEGLRALCSEHGTLLIFDEVMTGFRVARGGAQELYGIKPDLTCLGKIVGGGMPLAAYGGRRDVMSCIAPLGPVYQAGTLSGNPLSVAAGLVTLQEIESDPSLYQRLEEAGQHVERELLKLCAAAGVPVRLQRVGSMFTLFFTATPVVDYTTAKTSDTQRYAHWFRQLLGEGIYLAPSQFEAAFMGAAHTNADLDTFLAAAGKVLAGGF